MNLARHNRRKLLRHFTTAIVAAAMVCAAADAQELDTPAWLDALRGGGYVIVMRHASSPGTEPDAASAARGNVDRERQLDQLGRKSASAMGDALRQIGVPIGEILSSPRFRAMQTAELLGMGTAEPVPELGYDDEVMRQDEIGERSEWLRAEAAVVPQPGENRLMITHSPNILGAFGDEADAVAEGESLIIRPDTGAAIVIGRVTIEQWPQFAPP